MQRMKDDVAVDDAPKSRLLVADDDPAFRRAISFLLQGSGYEVTEAVDGASANTALDHAWLEGRPYEILLVDIRMQAVSGWDVLRHALREVPAGGVRPRVLLVTGFAGETDHARARREGASALLTKPISCEVLLREIRRVALIPRDIPAIHDASGHLTTTG